jgi:hypothetical protein
MGKKSRSGSGIQIRDEHPGSYLQELRNNVLGVKNTKILRCGCGSGILNILDPGSGIRNGQILIRDKHTGSATLFFLL